MADQPEAWRLADALEYPFAAPSVKEANAAAACLRRLYAEAEESEALRERLSSLLKSTAIALRGPEPELTSWSWHDLPERATALRAERDALLKALHNISLASQDSGSTREGMGLYARAAIAAVEGGSNG